ncbi:transpeptidase [Klebsiella aerogenes]|uniref:peptidoglycan meso-diaminopimelic acid protein amidase n=1 Tax=Klebsiella aerogenes TaxID=548 RepID=UPI0005EE306D|nr:peptidoglycan meso-diaminopimelic acid protein amidase [Klebsiella aerogenes]KJN08958.1 transpeptidase [Klebsiella aerogenes]
MRKIAFFIAMLLLPCVSFAGLLSSSSPTTPVSKEYKQQLMGSPVYIEIFKEERMLDLYVKMGETYQLLDSYRICNYSGGLRPKQRQGDFKSPEGFYNVSRSQLKPDSRFYKAINIGFPNAYDRAHGYEGKYLMIHGACVSVGCYAMTDTGIDEIFQFVTGALVFGQPSVQVSIYPFRMTDANMARHKFSYYADFWKQLKPGYDYFQQTHKPPVVSVMDGRYIVSKPLSHEVIQPQLASNYTLPEAK